MAHRIPKPPLMTKEQEEKWDQMENRYYKFMFMGVMVAGVLLVVLIGIIIYVKIFR